MAWPEVSSETQDWAVFVLKRATADETPSNRLSYQENQKFGRRTERGIKYFPVWRISIIAGTTPSVDPSCWEIFCGY